MNKKYDSPVAMGHPGPETIGDYVDYKKTNEQLMQELVRAKKLIKEYEERLAEYSWQLNPDRMGQ